MPLRGHLLPLLPLPLLQALQACGAPPPPAPAPPSLGYHAVGEPAATYVLGDTTRLEIDAGGETVDASVATVVTLDMEFRPADGGLTVTASLREFSARAANPMTPARTTRVEALSPPLVLSLDRRGEPTLVSGPSVGDDAVQFFSPEATSATLFPRLPGRPVVEGDRWTDTIRVETDQPGMRVDGSSVVTYVVAGDTLVGGRSLLLVTLDGEDHREISSSREGVDLSQSLDGTSTGWFLWDLARGLLRESVYDSELVGSLRLAEAPFPLSVRVRSRSELRLVEAAPGGDRRDGPRRRPDRDARGGVR